MHVPTRWLSIALMATGAWVCGKLLRDAQRRRALTSRAKPEPLQVWENEGGGVPAAGSRMAAQVDASR